MVGGGEIICFNLVKVGVCFGEGVVVEIKCFFLVLIISMPFF